MIRHGDCLAVMPTLPASSVDAVVTDPPYGLGFMGKHWDRGVPGPDFWAEMLRVAKPSSYLLAFGGTRTVHRIATSIEDAGWIIRDMLVWAYASGFPKSKASLKPAWEPIVMARKPGPLRKLAIDACRIEANGRPYIESKADPSLNTYGDGLNGSRNLGTTDLGRWPANVILTDPIFDGGIEGVVGGGLVDATRSVRVRAGSVIGNGNTHGEFISSRDSVGGYDDSGTYSRFFSIPVTMGVCRYCGVAIADESSADSPTPATPSATALEPASSRPSSFPGGPAPSAAIPSGDRGESTALPNVELWPGEDAGSRSEPLSTNDAETSTSPGRAVPTPSIPRSKRPGTSRRSTSRSDPATSADPSETLSDTTTTTAGRLMCVSCAELATAGYTPDATPTGRRASRAVPADSPSYTRFLLIPKADRAEREPIGGSMSSRVVSVWGGDEDDLTPGKKSTIARQNHHPTVKPVDLMRHLVRLVTPSGGVVLDPFLGSGTTGMACEMEGFDWIGIEREAEYVRIAEARLVGVQRGFGLSA